MNELGVDPDQDTYVNYVFPCFNDVKSVRAALQVGTSVLLMALLKKILSPYVSLSLEKKKRAPLNGELKMVLCM